MRPRTSFAVLLFLAILLALSTGCGTAVSNKPFPPGQSFVYVANNGSQTISVFKRDISTGALTEISGSPFAASVQPAFWSPTLTVDPKNLMLFSLGCNAGKGQLSVFVIDPDTGTLSTASGSPFIGSCGMRSISVDPQGRFVYASGDRILAWRIDRSHRTLIPVQGSPFGDSAHPYQGATVDNLGKFLYIAEYTHGIETFAIDPNSGALTLANGPFYIWNNAPFSISMYPSGDYAYVQGDADDLSLKLSVCAVIPSDGAVSFLEQEWGGVPLLALTPDGNFLITSLGIYSTPAGEPYLYGYSPDPLKSLLPTAAAVSPDSRFVYASANGALQSDPGSLSAFSLDETTGTLSPIPGSPYAVGAQPVAVAMTY